MPLLSVLWQKIQWIVGLVLIFAAFAKPAQSASIEDLATLLNGRFDNELQVFFEKDQKDAPKIARKRAHWWIQKQGDGGAFQVWLSETAESGNRRHYIFGLLAEGKSWSMSAAQGDSRVLECTVTWTAAQNGFDGQPKGKDCDELFPGTLKLSAEGLEAGRGDAMAADMFKRVRPFECWVAVLRGAKHGDDGKDAKDTDWFFKRGVWLHDQGGQATVRTDETPARDLRLRLRRVAWPSGPNRPSLTLYVLGEKDERALSYAWSEFDAERLGVNLRWMQASCTHAPDRLWSQ